MFGSVGPTICLLLSLVTSTQGISSVTEHPILSLSTEWEVLGPFQIGTRVEATWGADPLERFGGFRKLAFASNVTFTSSLGSGAFVRWSRSVDGKITQTQNYTEADLNFRFNEVDWTELQRVYGWAALQYQAWTRGHILVGGNSPRTVLLSIKNVIEFYIDGQHYFGGDMYAFGKAPVVLKLSPGQHRLDIRLIRDVRAMGGIGDPAISISVQARLSSSQLHIDGEQSLFPDVVGRRLSSPFASIVVRNDDENSVEITGITANDDSGAVIVESSDLPRSVMAGQTRSLPLRITCTSDCPYHIQVELQVKRVTKDGTCYNIKTPVVLLKVRSEDEPFKLTYQQSTGTVGYTMLKLPSLRAGDGCHTYRPRLPIMLLLHGAGVEADNAEHTHSLDDAGQLCSFVLFPTGGSPWSGDDWHQYGFTHIESAVNAAAEWARDAEWKGPQPDIHRLFVVGHSNGGQGTWYVLTHHPDLVMSAAPVSGYSSIQNYVPYCLWHPMDPAIRALLDGTLLSYRHELLLENLKDIPVLQQHGSADDNVPPYHSRLLRHLSGEVDADTTYNEVRDRGHWFDGVMTSDSLVDFYHTQLKDNSTRPPRRLPISVVTGRPLDTSSIDGIRIQALNIPGSLGRVSIDRDNTMGGCSIKTRNVAAFSLHGWDSRCKKLRVDANDIAQTSSSSSEHTLLRRGSDGVWVETRVLSGFDGAWVMGGPGGLDAILRTKKPVCLWRDSPDPAASHIALQISRNLHQYFGLDVEIVDKKVANATTIRIAIGGHSSSQHPLIDHAVPAASVEVLDIGSTPHFYSSEDGPIGAISLVPSTDEMAPADLVIWGSDPTGLGIAARLIPMLPGVGQPDFIVVDKQVMVKGAAGSLAMGFLVPNVTTEKLSWAASSNSFFT
ncbi:hypothetical protein K461DRAFT_221723 [Myriangium duriaei CBS 260.36]|uniref:Peptidase S9 prolyl oligopeptidase catalytic domain-containing protein n=1 Tax=Myriangium duriaei CBS 260.36 TaxID=1168546 RepID=A0A9P4MR47_9PEZI|nr:hypothetical protein K461DRAFT_221723 [Myriangium duriaei CBS 260.36]